jgi:hypothetical protein
MTPLLANPELKPTQKDIELTVAWFQELLTIRKSSRLFHLLTAEEIVARVRFLNTGLEQIPGLLVMVISGDLPVGQAAETGHILVAWNASNEEQAFTDEVLAGVPFVLHPVLRSSSDPIARLSRFDARSGTLVLPGRTVAVFVTGETFIQ